MLIGYYSKLGVFDVESCSFIGCVGDSKYELFLITLFFNHDGNKSLLTMIKSLLQRKNIASSWQSTGPARQGQAAEPEENKTEASYYEMLLKIKQRKASSYKPKREKQTRIERKLSIKYVKLRTAKKYKSIKIVKNKNNKR